MDRNVDIVGTSLGAWWPHSEVIMKIVHEISSHVVVFKNPFISIGKTVKEVWGRGQARVNEGRCSTGLPNECQEVSSQLGKLDRDERCV